LPVSLTQGRLLEEILAIGGAHLIRDTVPSRTSVSGTSTPAVDRPPDLAEHVGEAAHAPARDFHDDVADLHS
jgi:hypothetical protein